MKYKVIAGLFFLTVVAGGISFAVDEEASLGTQAGEAARDLKGAADETLSTGAAKVAESSRKVEAEAKETLKTLQQQWDEFAKQLQEKTQELRKQLEQQWQDFNKSFTKPPQS